MRYVNRVGERYGRLVVVSYAGKSKTKQTMWKCKCDCGNEKIVRSGDLTSRKTTSCGCYHKERITKHGLSAGANRHPLYATWNGMISRCHNEHCKDYKNYGGRGISVCKRWHDIHNFISDMGLSWQPGLQLDRIDNNGDYCKENCRWVNVRENLNNKRTTIIIHGINLTKLSEVSGISAATLRKRIRLGWNDINLLRLPSRNGRYQDGILNLAQISDDDLSAIFNEVRSSNDIESERFWFTYLSIRGDAA